MRLDPTLMGSQVGADPTEHPRWDGEKIRPYGADEEFVTWDEETGWAEDS